MRYIFSLLLLVTFVTATSCATAKYKLDVVKSPENALADIKAQLYSRKKGKVWWAQVEIYNKSDEKLQFEPANFELVNELNEPIGFVEWGHFLKTTPGNTAPWYRGRRYRERRHVRPPYRNNPSPA